MNITTFSNHTPIERDYPYIGVVPPENESPGCPLGIVVLFTSPEVGTCLDPGQSTNDIGSYSESWAEDRFVPLNGHITLSN